MFRSRLEALLVDSGLDSSGPDEAAPSPPGAQGKAKAQSSGLVSTGVDVEGSRFANVTVESEGSEDEADVSGRHPSHSTREVVPAAAGVVSVQAPSNRLAPVLTALSHVKDSVDPAAGGDQQLATSSRGSSSDSLFSSDGGTPTGGCAGVAHAFGGTDPRASRSGDENRSGRCSPSAPAASPPDAPGPQHQPPVTLLVEVPQSLPPSAPTPSRVQKAPSAFRTQKRRDPGALYQTAVRRRETLEGQLREQGQRLQRAEERECTFHPQITAFASKLRRMHEQKSALASHAKGVPRCFYDNGAERRRAVFDSESEDTVDKLTFMPTILRASRALVRRSRSQSGVYHLSVHDRLLHERELPHRQNTSDTGNTKPVARRTPRQIQQHVEKLLAHEAKREMLIGALRAEMQQLQSLHQPVCLDTSKIVARLVAPRATSQYAARREAALQEAVADHTFAPRINEVSSEYAAKARERRLKKWFYALSGGSEVLTFPTQPGKGGDSTSGASPMNDANHEAAPATHGDVMGLLTTAGVTGDLTCDAFVSTVAELDDVLGTQHWIWMSCGKEAGASPPTACPTFAPQVGKHSAALVHKKRSDAGETRAAHERLYEQAKKQQLEDLRSRVALEEAEVREMEQKAAAIARRRCRRLPPRQVLPKFGESQPQVLSSRRSTCDGGAVSSMSVSPRSCVWLHPSAGSQELHVGTSVELSTRFDIVIAELSQLLSYSGLGLDGETIHASCGSSLPAVQESPAPVPPPPAAAADSRDTSHSLEWVSGDTGCYSPEPLMHGVTEVASKTASTSRKTGQLRSGKGSRANTTVDLLLECSKLRPTLRADVEERRREAREMHRRLRAVGKQLYATL